MVEFYSTSELVYSLYSKNVFEALGATRRLEFQQPPGANQAFPVGDGLYQVQPIVLSVGIQSTNRWGAENKFDEFF
jgi:hypothetical protein